ncbi:probable sterol-C-methyltransferase [Synechococcus sp. CC9902]|uniref:methyltransferase domain-containing protein n=1 Tax=Synechococcus sp. (strain CC9902) TaxID=316279 RepID=UPI00005D4466|nr:methyltransferase domain-containing protein [Synechococcus sp. CC9902]ABB26983.1 probable sterol-C-methyltransferase [Synechococcus sp. CC9902]
MLASLLLLTGATAALSCWLWLKRDRKYQSSESVAAAYDAWTDDRLLERLWGDHVHLGHYGDPPRRQDFREAKAAFVHELVRWSGLDQLPAGSKVLDVGCGIGGSARILARDYNLEVVGISISPAQIARATELTPQGLPCRFEVMDALDLQLADHSFDAVWSVEAGPHMPDKQQYADELLRVLKLGGLLAVADWNRRDPSDGAMTKTERKVMRQLLNQWAHPEFASIAGFQQNLETSRYGQGGISTGDWSQATLPSWIDSIVEGLRRPKAVLGLGPKAVIQGLRETPTLLLMHWAFATGLMQFGVFKLKRH